LHDPVDGVGSLPTLLSLSLLGALIYFILLALPAFLVGSVAVARATAGSHARISILAGPVAALCFFPAAHLLACKLASVATGDLRYPVWISPFHFLPAWIVLCAALTIATRGAPRLGTRKRHWTFAGISAALAMSATLDGVEYLLFSVTGSSQHAAYEYPTPAGAAIFFLGIAISFFAVPVFVTMVYQFTGGNCDPTAGASLGPSQT
jgi:hypothetical protein